MAELLNRLTVEGDPEDLDRFRKQAEGTNAQGVASPLAFSALIPEPDLSPLQTPPPGCPIGVGEIEQEGGASWRWVEWGTDRECQDVQLEAEPDRLIYGFETSGTAPFNWVKGASAQFRNLEFTLEWQDEGSEEDAHNTWLRCVVKDGVVLEADRRKRVEREFLFFLLGRDPWLYFFFANPQALEEASTLMSGSPPEGIRWWIEARNISEDGGRVPGEEVLERMRAELEGESGKG